MHILQHEVATEYREQSVGKFDMTDVFLGSGLSRFRQVSARNLIPMKTFEDCASLVEEEDIFYATTLSSMLSADALRREIFEGEV